MPAFFAELRVIDARGQVWYSPHLLAVATMGRLRHLPGTTPGVQKGICQSVVPKDFHNPTGCGLIALSL